MTQDFYYIALVITLIFILITIILMLAMIKIYINVTRIFNSVNIGRSTHKNDK